MNRLIDNLFDRRDRILLFLPPLLGLLLIAIEAVGLLQIESQPHKVWRAVVNLVAFDSTHIAFTFILLVGHQQYRGWFKESEIISRKNPWLWIFGLFCLLTIFRFELLPAAGPLNKASVEPFFDGFWLLIPFLHSYAQSIGLYLANLPKNNSYYTITRNLLYGSMTIILAQNILNTETLSSVLQTHTKGSFGNLLLTTIWFSLFATALFTGRFMNGKKEWIFLSRFLIWPFIFYSNFAPILIGAVHGTEYLYFYLKIRKSNQQITSQTKFYSFVIFGLIFLLAINGSYYNQILPNGTEKGWLFPWLQSIFWIAIAFHYLMDRLMYRMKSGLSRQYFGPLLNAVKF